MACCVGAVDLDRIFYGVFRWLRRHEMTQQMGPNTDDALPADQYAATRQPSWMELLIFFAVIAVWFAIQTWIAPQPMGST
jgi:hypothetical protein